MFQDEDFSLSDLLDPDSEPTILRAPDVGIMLGCGPDAARTLIKSEGFPVTNVGSRNYIVVKKALLKWLDDLVWKERGEL